MSSNQSSFQKYDDRKQEVSAGLALRDVKAVAVVVAPAKCRPISWSLDATDAKFEYEARHAFGV